MSDTPKLSVIAPCYNEQDNVALLVNRTLATFDTMDIPAELVLVDDGSADATWQRIEEAMADNPRVRAARHAKNRGIEGGWRTGIATARGELLCLIDSDLQNQPEDIARLYRAYVERGPDLVQAVRNPKGDKTRLAFSRALNHILNVTFGMKLRDNKSGFILCERRVLETILEHRFDYRYYQSFIGCSAGVHGYRVAEVDTDFAPRHAGVSFLSNFPIRVSLRILVELAKFRIETLDRKSR